ncbi:MAG: type VI secretion system tip protein TssI/VgrG [Myxococcota bacterium]
MSAGPTAHGAFDVTMPPLSFALAIETTGDDDGEREVIDGNDWRVRSVQLDEELDAPYTMTAVLITEDTLLDVDRLVGGRCNLEATRPGFDGAMELSDERVVHGIVLRADYLGTHSHRMHLRVVVGPALCLLALTRRSRVFQEQTVVEIAQAVVADVFEATGRRLVASSLAGTYEAIDYCVQYNETDLDFFHRVLAEAGITYVWDHSGDVERVVLIDSNEAMAPLGSGPLDDHEGEPPTMIDVVTGAQTDSLGLSKFGWVRRVETARHEMSAWDWKDTSPGRFVGSVESVPHEPWQSGEVVRHASRRLIEIAGGAGPHVDPTLEVAERAMARSAVETAYAQGASNLFTTSAGATFECAGHPNPHLERGFLVTRATHRADIPAADVFAAGASMEPFVNEFEATSLEQDYRPRQREKPSISGPQLATVVGPPGEEIHTDAFGRVKVWMHWDRAGAPGETADLSCWLRVAQLWAGPGYGAFFLPRVGMEVVVQFLDGDPDRPLITGCVYNGRHPPPYALPDERTKSTIKTASSPGGVDAGFNELRFEDARGREQIYLHAQRNLSEVVGAAHSTRVGGNQTITVKKDRTKTIQGDEEEAIQGSRTTVVSGSTRTSVAGGRMVEVYCGPGEAGAPPGVDELNVLGERRLYADEKCVTEVGPARTTNMEMTPEEIVLKASKKVEIQVGATVLTITPEKIWAATMTTEVVTTGASLKLDDNAVLKSSNQTEVKQGVAALKLKNNRARLKSRGTKLDITKANAAVITLGDEVDVRGKSVILKPTEGDSHLRVNKDSVTSYGNSCNHQAGLIFKILASRIDLN